MTRTIFDAHRLQAGDRLRIKLTNQQSFDVTFVSVDDQILRVTEVAVPGSQTIKAATASWRLVEITKMDLLVSAKQPQPAE